MFDYLRKTKGILGINERNQKYIRPSGFRRAIRIVDNKLKTKKILQNAGIPVPETYGQINTRRALYEFSWEDLPLSFTIKPNRGHGGKGIVVFYGRKKGEIFTWVKADGSFIRLRDLQLHILEILDGYYSLSGVTDVAFFEERIKISPDLKPYTFKGVPDIRVLVYNQVPIMAELRLPTKESEGKANLHLGAIGVGIDLTKGETTNAILRNKLIDYVPGSRNLLRGIHIPYWDDILEISVRCQLATKVGFMGVDIALDRDRGPVVLELNARPGLSIQVANLSPLGDRLARVRGLSIKSPKRGVRVAKELFGEENEEEEPAKKPVLGINEQITIIAPDGAHHETVAKIDTGAYRTSVSKEIAQNLKTNGVVRYKTVKSALGKEDRPIIELRFKLDGKIIETEAFVADRTDLKKDVIVGRKDIKGFIIDPSKNILLGSNGKTP